MLTPSTRRLATWSHALRAQRRPLYAVPVCVLTVPPQTVQRYRQRRPHFVGNEPWPTMLKPSFPRLSHPRLAQAIPSIACIAHVSLGGTRGFRPKISEVKAPDQQRPAQAPIFAAIEVWSRLWPSTVVGRRSYRNTWALMRDISTRMEFAPCPLIVTDGFDFYEKVIRRVFGPAVLLGQVLKTRRHDRIVQVDRRKRMGASWRFEAELTHSEDSSTLNTSFIERMNLTIRQGSAYLSRRTLSHARSEDKLEEHLELLRCHYNFVRPHGALKFGREVRTPAMQAGLATRRLTFREIFVGQPPSLISINPHRRDRVSTPRLCTNRLR